jgi:hypothetical protein
MEGRRKSPYSMGVLRLSAVFLTRNVRAEILQLRLPLTVCDNDDVCSRPLSY